MSQSLPLKAMAVALATAFGLELASVPAASAQVYLRRNTDGVLEATDSP